MFSFLRYPLRYAQICTLCLVFHLSVMMVKITIIGLARNEKPKQRESTKIVLIWSPENHDFVFNQKILQRFAILSCSYTTCWDIKDFMDNITHVDAIVLDWNHSKMQHKEPRVLQKYTVESKDSAEFQCPDFFNGLLNRNRARNSGVPYNYIAFKSRDKIEPKNRVHFSEVSGPWWIRFRNKTNKNFVLQLTSNRPWKELVEDHLEKAGVCLDMVLKSHIVDNVKFMTFCNSVFTITN